MPSHALNIYPPQRFRVRDVSQHKGLPRFDLIFDDFENAVERYSESVWETEAQAQIQATMLEEAQARPVHWGVVRPDNEN